MTQPQDEQPAYLRGEPAIDWFRRTKGGLAIYDGHLSAVYTTFGPDAIRDVRAAVDPRTGRPQVLIVEVGRPGLTADESWALMLAAQSRLLEQGEQLSEQYGVNPFGRIVLTVDSTSENWFDFVDRIEGQE